MSSQFKLKSLLKVDTDQLEKVLAYLLKTVENQEKKIAELEGTQLQHVNTLQSHEKDLKNIHLSINTFEEGLEKIYRMNDKVDSWNERFRTIEETNFKINQQVSSITTDYQKKIKDLRAKLEESSKQISNDLKREIVLKFSDAEKNSNNAIKEAHDKLHEEISSLKQEINQLEQRIESNEAELLNYDSDEAINEDLQEDSQEEPQDPPQEPQNPSQEPQDSAEDPQDPSQDPPQDPSPNSASRPAPGKKSKPPNKLKVIETRLKRLESFITEQPQVFDDQGLPIEETNRQASNTQPEEPSLRGYSRSSAQSKQRAPSRGQLEPIKAGQSRPSSRMNSPTQSASQELKQVFEMYENLVSKVNYLEQQIEGEPLAMEQIEEEKPKSGTKELPQISKTPKVPANQAQRSFGKRINEIEDYLDEIQEYITRSEKTSEMDEKIDSRIKRFKDNIKNDIINITNNINIKNNEFESRLNGMWKNNSEVLELLQGLEQRVGSAEEQIKQENENLKAGVESEINSVKGNFQNKLEEVRENLNKFHIEKTEPKAQESHLKPLVDNLYFELAQLKENFESLQEGQQFEKDLFDEEPEEPGKEMPKEEQGQIKTILNRHESAIKNLASKLMSLQMPEVPSVKTESGVNLEYLEDLKREMKEVMQKQDSSKGLSNKDLELLNEVYQNLETKSNKSELVSKVEKGEMKRVYRMLKKKIDDLAATIRKNENANTGNREDAFFLKKKYDYECASCGNLLSSSNLRPKSQFYNKFPVRNSTFGPGFSHILQSLVKAPSGNFTIPPKKEEKQGELRNNSISSSQLKPISKSHRTILPAVK